ncbi:MAG: DUF2125 domain-containing protein [Pseudomonadota bacterium]
MSETRSFFAHPMAKWALFVVMLFVLWFGGWFVFSRYLDGQIGQQISRLETRGVEIECQDRAMVGFPFRIGVLCARTAVSDPRRELLVQAGELRTTAVVHDPTRIIAELKSPMIIQRGRAELMADWSAMRLFVDGDLSGGFEIISLNGSALKIAVGEAEVAMEKGDFHLRPNPVDTQALDVAFSTTQLTANPTADVSIAPATLSFNARMDDAYGQLVADRAPMASYLGRQGSALLRYFVLSTPNGGELAFSGPVTWNGDGTLSGEVTIGIAQAQAVGAWAAQINPNLEQAVAGIGQAVAGMGAKASFGSAELPSVKVTIDKNVVKLGFITLTTLPKFGV